MLGSRCVVGRVPGKTAQADEKRLYLTHLTAIQIKMWGENIHAWLFQEIKDNIHNRNKS